MMKKLLIYLGALGLYSTFVKSEEALTNASNTLIEHGVRVDNVLRVPAESVVPSWATAEFNQLLERLRDFPEKLRDFCKPEGGEIQDPASQCHFAHRCAISYMEKKQGLYMYDEARRPKYSSLEEALVDLSVGLEAYYTKLMASVSSDIRVENQERTHRDAKGKEVRAYNIVIYYGDEEIAMPYFPISGEYYAVTEVCEMIEKIIKRIPKDVATDSSINGINEIMLLLKNDSFYKRIAPTWCGWLYRDPLEFATAPAIVYECCDSMRNMVTRGCGSTASIPASDPVAAPNGGRPDDTALTEACDEYESIVDFVSHYLNREIMRISQKIKLEDGDIYVGIDRNRYTIIGLGAKKLLVINDLLKFLNDVGIVHGRNLISLIAQTEFMRTLYHAKLNEWKDLVFVVNNQPGVLRLLDNTCVELVCKDMIRAKPVLDIVYQFNREDEERLAKEQLAKSVTQAKIFNDGKAIPGWHRLTPEAPQHHIDNAKKVGARTTAHFMFQIVQAKDVNDSRLEPKEIYKFSGLTCIESVAEAQKAERSAS